MSDEVNVEIGETLVNGNERGPNPVIDCADNGASVTTSWVIPEGQLLDTGAVYVSESGSGAVGGHADFAGEDILAAGLISVNSSVEPGDEYQANLVLSYEGGSEIYDVVPFVCETVTTVAQPTATDDVSADTLPFTGPDPLLGWALALVLAGTAVLKFGKRLVRR